MTYTYDYYKTWQGYELRRTDSNGHHSYLKCVYDGSYTWCSDYLYSKKYSLATVKAHFSKLSGNGSAAIN